MVYPLVVTLREGIEAALVIGIIIACLRRLGAERRLRAVWIGIVGGIVASIVAGVSVYYLAGELEGVAEYTFEGIALWTAVIVLTYLVHWMRANSRRIQEFRQQVAAAAQEASPWPLALLSFVVIVREGIETVLFLAAGTVSGTGSGTFWLGAVLGLAIAVALGLALYRGTVRLNLQLFFNVTTALIILFAAGMLAHGIKEFQEAGLLPGGGAIWDLSGFLADTTGVGSFLRAIFGYDDNPSLLQALAYAAYIVVVGLYYFRFTFRFTGRSEKLTR
ncbi:MAG: FTR1 family protein [Limnochordales bacterium]|nr:FTR1 family protein [Limnochordales bacterium]